MFMSPLEPARTRADAEISNPKVVHRGCPLNELVPTWEAHKMIPVLGQGCKAEPQRCKQPQKSNLCQKSTHHWNFRL